ERLDRREAISGEGIRRAGRSDRLRAATMPGPAFRWGGQFDWMEGRNMTGREDEITYWRVGSIGALLTPLAGLRFFQSGVKLGPPFLVPVLIFVIALGTLLVEFLRAWIRTGVVKEAWATNPTARSEVQLPGVRLEE